MEQLIESGSEEMASVFAGLFNLAMRIERERFLGASHYERNPERRGYANGTRPKSSIPRPAAGAPAAPSCWRSPRCTSKASPTATPRPS